MKDWQYFKKKYEYKGNLMGKVKETRDEDYLNNTLDKLHVIQGGCEMTTIKQAWEIVEGLIACAPAQGIDLPPGFHEAWDIIEKLMRPWLDNSDDFDFSNTVTDYEEPEK